MHSITVSRLRQVDRPFSYDRRRPGRGKSSRTQAFTTMAQIIVDNLVKTFRVSERASGLWGAVRGLVR